MISILLISLFTAIVALFFFWYKSLPKYKIGNFPVPPRYFLIGHVPYLNSNDKVLPYIHKQLTENNGFAQLHIGPKVVLAASDPEFLKWIFSSTVHVTKSDEYQFLKPWLGRGLLLGTGSHWKLHRKILTPAFHFKMIENHISVLRNVTTILIEKFEEHLDKPSVDIYPLIAAFALDAVCESTMATSVNAQTNYKSDYITSVQNLCRLIYERTFDVLKMYDFLFQFFADYKVFRDSVKNTHDFTNAVVKQRREELKNGIQQMEIESENIYERRKTPFIDILLSAKDENDEFLSDQDIMEEVNTIVFAGYETTASAISFALYNLAKYPDVQRQAFEEQKELFGKEKNPFVTYADLNNMKYLEMTIKESLRIYPSIPMIGRRIQEDTLYDGKLLPEGMALILCLYTLHRNPKLFPDPEKFDPRRFESDSISAYSFLPFSAGQRNCIGQKFAMIEIKQAISTILRYYEILPVPNFDLNVRAETSLKSTNGICVKLKRREHV